MTPHGPRWLLRAPARRGDVARECRGGDGGGATLTPPAHPACADCGKAHGPAVTCEGKAIDWQARAERARAFTRAWAAAKPHERERMRYEYE